MLGSIIVLERGRAAKGTHDEQACEQPHHALPERLAPCPNLLSLVPDQNL